MSSLSPVVRSDVAQLRDHPRADVLVVGGGINGIATFRELALNGVDVILVERDDFVSGASSASSHMVHGGVRYLENGEFRLVSEAVHERNRLLKNAPHYVKPLQTVIPIFKTFSGILSAPLRFLTHRQGKPKERGAFLIKIGLLIYDTFSRDGGSVPRHRFAGRAKTLREYPDLNPNVRYTASYFDAAMHDPERIALDVLSDGIVAGGRAANYLEVVGQTPEGIQVHDRASDETFTIAAEVVVNTSGQWTDLTNSALGKSTRFMGGTKGSHIVMDHPKLYEVLKGRELFFENDDGRIVLIYPLKGRVMVGTTDIDVKPTDPVACTEEEIEYFFNLVAHVFPEIELKRSQIIYTFSGVRPLPRHDDEAPGFVSRDYRIERVEEGSRTVFSLVGGKWTTFRALGEHLSGLILTRLGRPHDVSTVSLAIGGGKGFPRTESTRRGWIAEHRGHLSDEQAGRLLDRYGTRATEVIAAIGTDSSPVTNAPHYFAGEIRYLARDEAVVHLGDVIYRRTSLAFTGSLSLALLHELAELVGDELSWDAERRRDELSELVADLATAHLVHLDSEEAPIGRS